MSGKYNFNFDAPAFVPSFEIPPTPQKESVAPAAKPKTEDNGPLYTMAKDLQSEEAAALFTEEDATDKKEKMSVIFIGHVDAGKSTLGGQILVQTGMVDKRTIEKYERESKELGRESWYLSWALDTNDEERDKGKTVYVGKAFFETEKRRFTILDAPGHKSYVPNMINGAAQADVAVLVISARRGEFEAGYERGGQTKEHAVLVKTNGINKLIVAVNKMDDPTVEWSKQRYDEIVTEMTKYLKNVGFNIKNDIYFVPISGFTGKNIKERHPCPFYSGPSLLELLDSIPAIDRNINAPLMIPIAEKVKDMGMLVTGKIEFGKVFLGQKVVIMPNKTTSEVMEIGRDDNPVKHAVAGENVTLKLKNLNENDVLPGFLVCDASLPVKVSNSFIARIQILDNLKSIMSAGYQTVLHIHTCVEEVVVGDLLHLIDRKTKKRFAKKPAFVKKNQLVDVRIDCAGLICVETFKDFPQLGRFTLRNENETIALGKILKVLDPKQ